MNITNDSCIKLLPSERNYHTASDFNFFRTFIRQGIGKVLRRVTLDAALRRVRPGTYRIRVIHGHHGGTALRELVRREYGRHPQVLRLEAAGPGVTELVLREF